LNALTACFSGPVRTCRRAPASYTVFVKPAAKPRSILHVDLDPFVVSVERSLDPSLRGRPLIVGSGVEDDTGVVAAASPEAREAGVRPGQSIAAARRRCPDAVLRPGDLETYARISEEVTQILLQASRRVERPSADEAYVDLTRDSVSSPHPVAASETIKDELQRRLGLDASLGLASSRLAARVASTLARPRGLLVVLPGYEASYLARQPIGFLPDLPPHIETALEAAELKTLGDLATVSLDALAGVVGTVAAPRLQQAARGEGEPPIPVSAPPTRIAEEAVIRDRRSDAAALLEVVDGVAARAARRLRPFDLAAGQLAVEVTRPDGVTRREDAFEPALADEATLCAVARSLAGPLLEPALGVRSIHVRLSRLARAGVHAPLFRTTG
jgi:DNA polymerase-4